MPLQLDDHQNSLAHQAAPTRSAVGVCYIQQQFSIGRPRTGAGAESARLLPHALALINGLRLRLLLAD